MFALVQAVRGKLCAVDFVSAKAEWGSICSQQCGNEKRRINQIAKGKKKKKRKKDSITKQKTKRRRGLWGEGNEKDIISLNTISEKN